MKDVSLLSIKYNASRILFFLERDGIIMHSKLYARPHKSFTEQNRPDRWQLVLIVFLNINFSSLGTPTEGKNNNNNNNNTNIFNAHDVSRYAESEEPAVAMRISLE